MGYDIPAIKKVTGYELLDKHCHDTLTLSMALQYKRGHKHGLASWGERLGSAKIDYHDWSGYNKDMLTYCKQDVHLNGLVYKKLLEEYSRLYRINPLIQRGLQVEHSVAKCNTIMRDEGWNFDVDRAKAVKAMFEERMLQIESIIEPKLGDHIIYIDKEPKTPKYKKDGTYNATTVRILSEYLGREISAEDTHLVAPGTPFQRSKREPIQMGQSALLKEWLLKNGWKPDEYTKKRTPEGGWVNISPKLTEKSLKEFGRDGEMISEYYTLRNRLSVVEGWLEKVKDGRLHGNMWTIGTPSFRCRHEVIVNLPAVSASYGKELTGIIPCRCMDKSLSDVTPQVTNYEDYVTLLVMMISQMRLSMETSISEMQMHLAVHGQSQSPIFTHISSEQVMQNLDKSLATLEEQLVELEQSLKKTSLKESKGYKS